MEIQNNHKRNNKAGGGQRDSTAFGKIDRHTFTAGLSVPGWDSGGWRIGTINNRGGWEIADKDLPKFHRAGKGHKGILKSESLEKRRNRNGKRNGRCSLDDTGIRRPEQGTQAQAAD